MENINLNVTFIRFYFVYVLHLVVKFYILIYLRMFSKQIRHVHGASYEVNLVAIEINSDSKYHYKRNETTIDEPVKKRKSLASSHLMIHSE